MYLCKKALLPVLRITCTACEAQRHAFFGRHSGCKVYRGSLVAAMEEQMLKMMRNNASRRVWLPMIACVSRNSAKPLGQNGLGHRGVTAEMIETPLSILLVLGRRNKCARVIYKDCREAPMVIELHSSSALDSQHPDRSTASNSPCIDQASELQLPILRLTSSLFRATRFAQYRIFGVGFPLQTRS